jgi:hypothetical protein
LAAVSPDAEDSAERESREAASFLHSSFLKRHSFNLISSPMVSHLNLEKDAHIDFRRRDNQLL